MPNPWSGEVEIVLDGEPHVLKLTLGALAELEDRLGADDLISLIERFEDGRFSSRDVFGLLVAGLRGGGWNGDERELLSAEIAGGPIEAARLAGRLLVRAFALPENAT